MNGERKAQWVAALRSGECQKGTGRLHRATDDGGRFCCLGVVSDLAWRDGAVSKELPTSGSCSDYGYGGQYSYPPIEVDRWMGCNDEEELRYLTYRDPQGELHIECLAALNDDYKLTFSQIADLIERWM